MTIQFAPKSVTLLANNQNTLTWGLADFSNTLGQDHGIIRSQISLSFQVTNNTQQVCYIGLSYTTIRNSYNVSDKKSIAAVPANSSLNITPLTVPSIAVIGPDIISITMTLLSAAAGTVVVNLQADNPQPNSGSGAPLFGLDDRSIRDYIPVPSTGIFDLGAGATDTRTVYQVPTGKRAQVKHCYITLCPTGSFIGDARMTIQVTDAVGTLLYILARLMSKMDEYTYISIPLVDLWLETGYKLTVITMNTSASTIVDNSYGFVINESF